MLRSRGEQLSWGLSSFPASLLLLAFRLGFWTMITFEVLLRLLGIQLPIYCFLGYCLGGLIATWSGDMGKRK